MKSEQPSPSSGRGNGTQPGTAGSDSGQNPVAPGISLPRLFTGVSAETYAGICRLGRPKRFFREEVIQLEDDPVERIVLLKSGLVKIAKVGPAGAEVIVRLAGPGEVLGAVSLCLSGRLTTTAQVLRNCDTLVWDARTFKDLIGRFPVLTRNLVAILGDYLRDLEERFREVATERVGSRVALQLLRLLETIGRPVDAAFEIGVSREELAQMTGTTLFTVSRLFSIWEARGAVRPRREAVSICNVQSLHAISEET